MKKIKKHLLLYIVPACIVSTMTLFFSGFLPAIPKPGNIQNTENYRLDDVEIHYLKLLTNMTWASSKTNSDDHGTLHSSVIRDDPFRKPDLTNISFSSTRDNGSAPLTLQGILWDGAHSRAVIDAKVVKKDDHIGTCKVMAISRHNVVLQRTGEQIVLRLDKLKSHFAE